MVNKRTAGAGVAAVLLVGLLPAAATADPETDQSPSASLEPTAPLESAGERVTRGLIVKTSAGDGTLRRAVQRSVGADIEVQVPQDLVDETSVVDFDTELPLDDAVEVAQEIASRDDVEWAVPNGRVQASAASPVTPNDPLFGRQVQLWDSTARAAGGFSTKAPATWRSTKGRGQVVAVLDTGVVRSHPDLRDQLVTGYDFVGPDRDPLTEAPLPGMFRGANDGDGRDADPSDPGDWLLAGEVCGAEPAEETYDSSWHGTHVAGIVAARQSDRYGISGVAPAARVQPVRVLGSCGGWDSDVLEGIEWASGGTVQGVPVNRTPAQTLNLSLGAMARNTAERDQICLAYGDFVQRAARRGSVVIAAAGNEYGTERGSGHSNADLAAPATCPGVISVAATSRGGRAAVYTNVGRSVDLSAYGGDEIMEGTSVLSAVDRGKRGPAGATHAGYDGTSMAAPAVAGAAALVRSLGVPASRVEAVLKRSTQRFAASSKGWGNVTLEDGEGRSYVFDVNCTTSRCGAGVLDLTRLPIVTSVTSLPTRVPQGRAVRIKGRVTIGGHAVRGGPVEVRRGSTVLARGSVDSQGRVSIRVPAKKLRSGKNALSLRYGQRWSGKARTVTVTKRR